MRITNEPTPKQINKWWKLDEFALLHETRKIYRRISYRMLESNVWKKPQEILDDAKSHLNVIDEIIRHRFNKQLWLDDDTYHIVFKELKSEES